MKKINAIIVAFGFFAFLKQTLHRHLKQWFSIINQALGLTGLVVILALLMVYGEILNKKAYMEKVT